jgi:hypothetical protein
LSASNLAFAARRLREAQLPVGVVAGLSVVRDEAAFVELVRAMGQSEPPSPWLATRDRLASHVDGTLDERELSAAASEVESFLDKLKQGGPARNV